MITSDRAQEKLKQLKDRMGSNHYNYQYNYQASTPDSDGEVVYFNKDAVDGWQQQWDAYAPEDKRKIMRWANEIWWLINAW